MSAESAGRSNAGSYSTPARYSPSGAKVGAATRRSRAASSSAIHAGRLLPGAHVDQRAHDVADHVVQERVGAKGEQRRALPRALHARLQKVAHRRLRLALRVAERGEVVLAQQEPRGLRPWLHVERAGDTNPRGRAGSRARRAHRAAGSGRCASAREARVEILAHRARPEDARRLGAGANWCRAPRTTSSRRALGYRNGRPGPSRARRRRCVPRRSPSTGTSASGESACCRWSCTPQPPGWVCQPQKAAPSYSRPRAMRMEGPEGKSAGSALRQSTRYDSPERLQRGDELLRLFALRRGAFLGDLLEDLARAVLVADLEVRLGELELGADGFAPPSAGASRLRSARSSEPLAGRGRGARGTAG